MEFYCLALGTSSWKWFGSYQQNETWLQCHRWLDDSFSKSYLLVLINFSCITKNNRLDFFNHRNLFLTILEAGSPRSRCHHDHSFSVDSGLQRAILCLCLHIVFCVCMCVGGDRNEASFWKGTDFIMKALPSWAHLKLFISQRPSLQIAPLWRF